MISKELIEAVYGKKIISFGFCVEGDRGQTTNYKKYTILFEDGKTKYVTINDFFFDCKEWAFKNGFEIVVLAYSIKIYRNSYEVYNTNTKLFDLEMFFKACQWILEND